MSVIFLLLLALAGLGGIVYAVRARDAATWRRSLVAYRLDWPASLSTEDVARWLTSIAAQTQPMRLSLLRPPPVALEITSNASGITYVVLVPKDGRDRLLASLKGALPGVRATELPDYLTKQSTYRLAAELTMTSQTRPLAAERAEAASAAFIAALQPAGSAEIRMQWLLVSAGTPPPVPTTHASRTESPAWGWENAVPKDAEAVQAARKKQAHPLLWAIGRLGVTAPNDDIAEQMLGKIWPTFHTMNAQGVRLRRRMLPSSWVARQLAARSYSGWSRWPLLVNSAEGAGLLGLPVMATPLPGLSLGTSRQLPPAPDTPRTGCVIGETTYPGTQQLLAIHPKERVKHLYLVGPTGTGKSTLLANLALQDAVAGKGMLVLDPKDDLVDAVLARLPEKRLGDVRVLDAVSSRPLGLNPLHLSGSEYARELAAEQTVHIFKSIYKDFWGPRTDDLLRASLISLTQVPAPNGQHFALTEVAELLTSPELRTYVMRSSRLDERWRRYWQDYHVRSEADQLAIIGPVLNKLRAVTHRASLRGILGQSDGLQLRDIFTKRAIVLVPLSSGQIGTEAANLLGSLAVGALWAATLQRTAVPTERRSAVNAYLDEFQQVVRISDDLTDMLGMARGLGLGLTLANQYIKQLPEPVRAAVLGTARSQLFYQLDYDDAQTVAKRFSPLLTADDFMGLPAYEFVARLTVNGSTRPPVTAKAFPLPPPNRDPRELRQWLAERDGTDRAAVDADLHARSRPRQRPGGSSGFGRVPSGDGGTS
ncbi:type IV secretory system conjugative DNA transfer family protein [Fodinicola acaciae]|uniref:type IV secretory system conjugative DNA transfer family protein n=1 Tax=Fodinicola acaciae TaxID=2681555 RepID=UPI0013D8269C|nr:type IV secretory system conjugative DNA transfer family protein [Fodinicola acaciae]